MRPRFNYGHRVGKLQTERANRSGLKVANHRRSRFIFLSQSRIKSLNDLIDRPRVSVLLRGCRSAMSSLKSSDTDAINDHDESLPRPAELPTISPVRDEKQKKKGRRGPGPSTASSASVARGAFAPRFHRFRCRRHNARM